MLQAPQWMPETVGSTELCMYRFPYTYIPMIKFNLHIRHTKKLVTMTTNEIEQL